MAHIIEGVPFISQLIVYPTGCESVSAVMALQYLGWDGTCEKFIDELLPKGKAPEDLPDGSTLGDDPWEVFPGDPYSQDGWGCFIPVLEKAIGKLPEYRTESFYGAPLEDLKKLIDQDIPVIFWATIGFVEPRRISLFTTTKGKTIRWVSPMHCTLLIGYDEDGYIFNDPTSGEKAHFTVEQVERAYRAQGMQSMILKKVPEQSRS